MRRDLVEKRGWLDESTYDRGLAIATACPGPMAYQLGVYCGYVTHGVPGALAIAVAFALPPFAIVVVIAALYERFAGAGVVRGLFYGIGPVVVALILRASLNLGRKTLKRTTRRGSLRSSRASSRSRYNGNWRGCSSRQAYSALSHSLPDRSRR